MVSHNESRACPRLTVSVEATSFTCRTNEFLITFLDYNGHDLCVFVCQNLAHVNCVPGVLVEPGLDVAEFFWLSRPLISLLMSP